MAVLVAVCVPVHIEWKVDDGAEKTATCGWERWDSGLIYELDVPMYLYISGSHITQAYTLILYKLLASSVPLVRFLSKARFKPRNMFRSCPDVLSRPSIAVDFCP